MHPPAALLSTILIYFRTNAHVSHASRVWSEETTLSVVIYLFNEFISRHAIINISHNDTVKPHVKILVKITAFYILSMA